MLKIVLITMFFALSSFAFTCEECTQFGQELSKLEKSAHRLEAILKANEDFIATLDPTDESELIKARSNVNIAKKRILASQEQAPIFQANLLTPSCKTCSGEKI